MQNTGISGLLRNILWLTMAEGCVRATRIFAALALAYALEPAVFGAAALIMTVAELMRTPTRNGVLQSVIRVGDSNTAATLATASRLNWIVHLGLAIAQILMAPVIAGWLDTPELAAPIAVTASIFLFYPMVFSRVALLHRAQEMQAIAKLSASCLSFANIATAILAVLGFGLWSVVIPRLLSAALWVVLAKRMHPAPVPFTGQAAPWKMIFGYGQTILVSELFKTARLNLDKILIGKILGMEALGIYAFAFNAGLGLSQSLVKGFSEALFPWLCARGRNGDIRQDAVRLAVVSVFAALILFGTQAALAPYYVPVLFGDVWTPAIPVMIVLCLSAIPQPLWEVGTQLVRAEGNPSRELRWSAGLTFVVLSAVICGALYGGTLAAAVGVLLANLIIIPTFAHFIIRKPNLNLQGTAHAT